MNAVANTESAPAARYTKISADGSVLPREATEWEAVLDNRTGLMWSVKFFKVPNWRESEVKKAEAKLKKMRDAGFDDWRAPSVEELFTLPDRTKVNPAIDTDFFPDTPSDWFWTSTPDCESPAGRAWVVAFYLGISGRDGRGGSGFVRGVRVGQ